MDNKEERTFSVETNNPFLLETFSISSVQGIVLAMVFSLVIAAVFHTLNFVIYFRERHYKKKSRLRHCVTTLFHTVSAVLAYVMVCCVKTMNVWLFASIVLGSGVGQLVIGPFASSHFEQKHWSKREKENEPLYDGQLEDSILKTDNHKKNKDILPKVHNERDIKLSNRNTSKNPIPINLDDFIINKTKPASRSENEASARYFRDDDDKSVYDSLMDHYTGDLKLFPSDETRL